MIGNETRDRRVHISAPTGGMAASAGKRGSISDIEGMDTSEKGDFIGFRDKEMKEVMEGFGKVEVTTSGFEKIVCVIEKMR